MTIAKDTDILKRVVAVNDMSCFGKCSLTVALPVISGFGVEAVPLPTAILSTHTGGFEGFTCLDMTDEMMKIIGHWQKIKFRCDGIYTGYFCNIKQIDITEAFIKEFATGETVVLVDPVMADNGKLYTGFNEDFVDHIARLCAIADVITPNMTEALLLAGMEYKEILTRDEVAACIDALGKLGAKKAVITGVQVDNKTIGYVCKDYAADTGFEIFYPHVNLHLHGCGDVFASALCGGLVEGDGLLRSVKTAAEFTQRCITSTGADMENHWYGLKFEKNLREGI